MKTTLKNIAFFSDEKIKNESLTTKNYISVDNMLQNKQGICEAARVPASGFSIKFRKGDILIGNIRPYLKKIWYATFDGGCSQDVLCIRFRDNHISSYVYAILSSDDFFAYSMNGKKGSKMPRGDKKHIMNFEFPLPNECEKFGEIICQIDSQIQRNQDLCHKLRLNDTTISCFSMKGEMRYAN